MILYRTQFLEFTKYFIYPIDRNLIVNNVTFINYPNLFLLSFISIFFKWLL